MSRTDKRRPQRCPECLAGRACPLPTPCPPAAGGAWEFTRTPAGEQRVGAPYVVVEKTVAHPAAMRLVVVESPYAGDVERNVAYTRAALRDCLLRGEAPLASHLLYTQPGVLDDGDPGERAIGIEAGLAWGELAAATVVYCDFGISRGMALGIDRALAEGRLVESRYLPEWVAGYATEGAP